MMQQRTIAGKRGLAAMLMVLALAFAATVRADDALRSVPASVVLIGPDSAQQLAIEAVGMSGDRTHEARFESADPSIASVDPHGLVVAVGDGFTSIRADVGGQSVSIPVTVERVADPPPIHFADRVVPIFTKLGCNSGGCHGKASGQNGFRLSLLGFDPPLDYETLVREGRGRRLFPAAPEASLLLTKAVGKAPHGGGRKLEEGSRDYRTLVRWIAAGMPVGPSDAPKLIRLSIEPPARSLPPGGTRQQLVVTAHYSDGHVEDVTRSAQFQANDPDVIQVNEGGRIESRDLAGQAAVMARYQGLVAVTRLTVPLGQVASLGDFRPRNLVDVQVAKQWQELGLSPSADCSDAEFLRRASLDLNGTLPTAADARRFAADPDPEKRLKLVDRLLERPEYAKFFAIKWADILRNKRENNAGLQAGTFRFHDWIEAQLATNVPYDRFVRSILTASGTAETAPPVVWYRRLRTPDALVDDTAQVFLGMRLQCAKCHHHPFEVWSQDDYYGFAAFFSRVGRKLPPGQQPNGQVEGNEAIFAARAGAVSHPRTGKAMAPKLLGGPEESAEAGADLRDRLAAWLGDPANPYFARALVNRYWAHFFNRGVAEPPDDLRASNPPSNPELLDALAADFVASGYDLKHLIRTIATSRVFGLSSLPNESNARDRQAFARYYPKRIGAEVLLDSIAQLTGAPTAFGGIPAGTRAIELPDESVPSSFLDAFGRPKRDTACECERVTDASLGQSLLLLNSAEVQQKLSAGGGRAELLAKDPRPDGEKVEELFWDAFARAPSDSEKTAAVTHIQADPSRRKEAYEDILWALINAKEFQFVD
ncbi:MAG: DUF1549 domain-containing protein [Isosphaeraceae bacterium]